MLSAPTIALLGPDAVRTGLSASARIRVCTAGAAAVYTGTPRHGAGHETDFAQTARRPRRSRPVAAKRNVAHNLERDLDQHVHDQNNLLFCARRR